MLRVTTEVPATPAVPVPSTDDVEKMHESARERIRTILRRSTQQVEIVPMASAPEPTALVDVDLSPEVAEVAPIPSALRELPAPYESDQADEEIDLHESARKRIRKITQPIEVPLPTTTSASYAPDAEAASAPAEEPARQRNRKRLYAAGFGVAMIALAGLLNLRLITSAFNYDDLGPQQIRKLAPELGGGYIIKGAQGGQFIGYLLRESTQTSHERASVLASQILERLKDRGVREVVLLDRDNIPVAVIKRGI